MNDSAFIRAAFCLPVGLPAILCAAVIALIYGYAYVAVALAVRAAARSFRFIAP
jgi:hypothetical protein